MNHKHRKVVSGNISTRSVEPVLKEIEQRHGGRVGVRLNGHFAEFSHATHSLPPSQVQQLREFIASAGIDPERDYPL